MRKMHSPERCSSASARSNWRDGGTIFLDEIGDLPAEAQLALLRVVQGRESERVGGHRTIAVDVRAIAGPRIDARR
jgi:transcriptional regulator with GAF, ATPase, and Fis domain